MLPLLQQLTHDQRLTPHHVSLFLAVMTEQGLSDQPIEIYREQLMKKGKIGSKDKFYVCLADLHKFGYLIYCKGSRHSASTLSVIPELQNLLRALSPENRTIENQCPENGTLTTILRPENRTIETIQCPENGTLTTILRPENRTTETIQRPENRTIEHKTDTNKLNQVPEKQGNNTENTEVKTKEKSLKTVVPNSTISITTKNKNLDTTTVQEGVVEETKTPRQIKRTRQFGTSETDLPFTESELYDPQKFKEAFQDHERWGKVDFEYYREKVLTWRDVKTGQPPKRTDWKATIIQFFLNDYREQKLVTIITHATPKSTNLKPLGLAPHPKSGREFGTW